MQLDYLGLSLMSHMWIWRQLGLVVLSLKDSHGTVAAENPDC